MSHPHPIIQNIERGQQRPQQVDFRVGDTLRVHVRIREGDKERVQAFEGVVIRKREGSARGSFTVRKVSYGVGVERVFPLHSPTIDRIELKNRGRVRRARLYYLRDLRGKAARIRERIGPAGGQAVAPDTMAAGVVPDEVAVPEETTPDTPSE